MRSGAVKIAVIYTISGLLWIILSDKLLDLIKGPMDASFVLFLSSIKGFFYVLVTGLILYKLILKHDSRLAESEKLHRSYFEANPLPMWIYNKRTLNFTSVNNAAIAKYGYTHNEFLDMTVLDIRPKTDIGRAHTTIKSLRDGYNDSGVWTHLKKDGTEIRVRITSHTITFGKEAHIMVMATDVTGTEQASE